MEQAAIALQGNLPGRLTAIAGATIPLEGSVLPLSPFLWEMGIFISKGEYYLSLAGFSLTGPTDFLRTPTSPTFAPMDTPNDCWSDDGCETQLVSLDTPLTSVGTETETLDDRDSVATEMMSVKTDVMPPGTQLAEVCDRDEISPAEPVREESNGTHYEDLSQPGSNVSDGYDADSLTELVPPRPSLSLTSEAPSKQLQKEVGQAFLDYFLTYPIIKNLRDADLLNRQQLLKAANIWRQKGGKLEHVLVDCMGIKSTTIKFFNNAEAGTSAKQQGCTRIGEFLRAAGLVSEDDIQNVFEVLKQEGRSLKLGDALVDQGLVKQSTINFFANRFVNENASPHPDHPQKADGAADNFLEDDRHFRLDEFFFVVGQHGQFFSHVLRTRMYSIGRGTGNDIIVNDKFVSRRHAYLIRTQDKETNETTYEVLDCGKIHKYSTNGIYVNGKKVKHQALRAGDTIHIGPKIQARFLPVEETH